MPSPIHLDIVSDTICPWCYVGKVRLEQALSEFGANRVKIEWRPFQLDPSVPAGGVDRKTYMKKKFGDSGRSKSMLEALEAAGREEGLRFNFDAITRTPNTLNSHRLIRWSQSDGCQDAVVTHLFQAFFVQGKDIGDHDVLSQVAESAGMDGKAVAARLATDADSEIVGAEARHANEMGISGVPTFIANSKIAVSGAQPSSVLLQFLDKALKQGEHTQVG